MKAGYGDGRSTSDAAAFKARDQPFFVTMDVTAIIIILPNERRFILASGALHCFALLHTSVRKD
jgi:hypothetical protein